jgi:hypothetical protein
MLVTKVRVVRMIFEFFVNACRVTFFNFALFIQFKQCLRVKFVVISQQNFLFTGESIKIHFGENFFYFYN